MQLPVWGESNKLQHIGFIADVRTVDSDDDSRALQQSLSAKILRSVTGAYQS